MGWSSLAIFSHGVVMFGCGVAIFCRDVVMVGRVVAISCRDVVIEWPSYFGRGMVTFWSGN